MLKKSTDKLENQSNERSHVAYNKRDIGLWISKNIEACKTVEQCVNCRRLIYSYENIFDSRWMSGDEDVYIISKDLSSQLNEKMRAIISNPLKIKNMQTKKVETLDLLNSKGGILKMHETLHGILVVDQYRQTIGEFTVDEIVDYVNGKFDIIDSKGKVWHFPEQSIHMKPSPSNLSFFLGVEVNY
jgi:hypothetical protein